MIKLKILSIILLYFVFVVFLVTRNFKLVTPQNFLVLGLDPRDDLLEKTQNTDTIIYANLSPKFDSIKLFSLPRDLWSYEKSVKINQLYPDTFDNLQQNYKNIIGQNIDRTIVITTQNLKDIADIVGGIDVYLEVELKDTKYPNQDYISNPKSGTPIYKTIYYPPGQNHLDSSNITEFVRSRKSSESVADGGTDLGRIVRQQKLFDALLAKILQIQDPKQLLTLYNYLNNNISHNLVKSDYISLAIKILPNIKSLKVIKVSIPTGENPKTDIIYHPTKFINQQWVFITSTPDYQSLKNFISKSLLY